jgi:FtsP/CotA-like multicopper oxidase with cupredoxin domain
MKENFDPISGMPTDVLLNGKWFDAPVEETPRVGATEVWNYINLTVDAHPMHMHLVQFKIVKRQPLNVAGYTTAWQNYLANLGPKPVLANFLLNKGTTGPAPEEMGWKDTAKAYPGEVLQVAAKFDLPTSLPLGPVFNSSNEYVYHCHILEHEENEMMRPFTVG